MSPRALLPLGSLSAKKSIRKALTFYNRGGQQFVKHYGAPIAPPSSAQTEQRTIIKAKVAVWQNLTLDQRLQWKAQAEALGDPWSGYSLFMSLYSLSQEDFMSILNFRMPGRYHSPGLIYGPVGTAALTAGRLWAIPLFLGPAQSFDRIAYRVTTAVAAAVARLGIYLDNGSIYPGSRILDSGELLGTPAAFYEATINWVSEPYKLYWLAILSNKAITVRGMANTYPVGSIFGMTSATGTTQDNCLYVAFAYNALPAAFPGSPTYNTGSLPAVFLRKASP